ncbi:MAG: hypothetical protein ABIJ92_01320 [Candidatus Aenigmatarchaeota archaeon]
MNRVGQNQVISIVLITGIIISLVTAAYLWGAPLIEKRSTVTDVEIAKTFMRSLNDKIIDVANAGTGSVTMEIPNGYIKVSPYDGSDEDNNSVELQLVTGQQMVFPDTTVFLGSTAEEIGIYGEAEPNILTLEGEGRNRREYSIFIKNRYRELDTNDTVVPRGFQIAVNDGQSVISGTSSLSISFDKIETISAAAGNGGDLILTHITVVPV